MLIDAFAPNPDALETHSILISAAPEAVYHALWTTDLGDSLIIKSLLGLRSFPELVAHPRRPLSRSQPVTLRTVIDAGFGVLAERVGEEVLLGVTGRFWHPTGNLLPFNRTDFDREVPAGMARAVWNFSVSQRSGNAETILSTETRVVCGDISSRRKFRAYWLIVRPFSGLIRRIMLRNVRRAAVSYNLPAAGD